MVFTCTFGLHIAFIIADLGPVIYGPPQSAAQHDDFANEGNHGNFDVFIFGRKPLMSAGQYPVTTPGEPSSSTVYSTIIVGDFPHC